MKDPLLRPFDSRETHEIIYAVHIIQKVSEYEESEMRNQGYKLISIDL
jgi:hypothetical protein